MIYGNPRLPVSFPLHSFKILLSLEYYITHFLEGALSLFHIIRIRLFTTIKTI